MTPSFHNFIVRTYEDYKCKVLLIWKASIPNYASIAFQKYSPLAKFFNWAILKMREDGELNAISRKWKNDSESVINGN